MWWLMGDIISYENNVMLAAILSLLLVVLFVLVLHIYARWFLGRHRDRASSVSMAQVFGPARPRTTTTTTYDITSLSGDDHLASKGGLDPTVLNSIPIFDHHHHGGSDGEECAICLSVFEEGEKGRWLPRCSHAFHVECIDMWLHSHSNCPVCRAQVVVQADDQVCQSWREKIGHDDHHRTVEVEHDDDDDDDGNNNISTGEIVVEINGAGGHENENESLTSDHNCSLRRMLSLSSRSVNRIYPSSLSVVTQV